MKKIILTIFSGALFFLFAGATQANEWKSQRAYVQSALEASERDELDQKAKAGLSEHPLYSWIEVLAYKKRLNSKMLSVGDRQAVEGLLQRYNSLAAGDWLRAAYLNYLSSQKDWVGFSRFSAGPALPNHQKLTV